MPRKSLDELDKPAAKESAPKKEPIKYQEQEYQAEVVSTSDSTTRKVKLDLEVDTSVKDMGPNPYARLIHLARAIDAWRIFPRMFLTVYIVLLYKVVIWFMALDAPSFEQSGLVSIVVGAGAAWFGLYTGSSKSKK